MLTLLAYNLHPRLSHFTRNKQGVCISVGHNWMFETFLDLSDNTDSPSSFFEGTWDCLQRNLILWELASRSGVNCLWHRHMIDSELIFLNKDSFPLPPSVVGRICILKAKIPRTSLPITKTQQWTSGTASLRNSIWWSFLDKTFKLHKPDWRHWELRSLHRTQERHFQLADFFILCFPIWCMLNYNNPKRRRMRRQVRYVSTWTGHCLVESSCHHPRMRWFNELINEWMNDSD